MEYPNTKQEIFDFVMNHLWNQNKKSENAKEYFENSWQEVSIETSCLYRNFDDGSKCAIGCLIPDNLYRPSFETKSVDGLILDIDAYSEPPHIVTEDYRKFINFLSSNLKFLMSLQILHDNYNDITSSTTFRNYLLKESENVAIEYNLIPFVPPVKETNNTL